MVSLAYLVKRRSVEPENRVRSPGDTPNIKSHSSSGQSTGLLNRGLKVQIFLGLPKMASQLNWIEHGFSKPRVTGSNPVEVTKRSIEVTVTCPTVSWVLRVRFSHRPQRFMERFCSGCLPEKDVEVNLQSWKDNGGCLPVLDAGGRKFESCFPDRMISNE